MQTRRLMALVAHPDDEAMVFGGTLAKYAAAGVETAVVSATRGDAGRHRGRRPGDPAYPGAAALAAVRAQEFAAAAAVLGVRDAVLLDYPDKYLDQADVGGIVENLARHIRRFRPAVVLTFGPDGAYGHPDHIAISQYATAAVVAAGASGDRGLAPGAATPPAGPHVVSKLYFAAWPAAAWSAFDRAFPRLASTVDGTERRAAPWPDWAVTTYIDARAHWETAWRAVACHESQVTAYGRLNDLSPAEHEQLWGRQWYYRVFSTVNRGRTQETDLFDGVAP
ncbi:MAG: PIG-L family deacetylase [Vicinamibacterales bacterium]